MKAPNTHHSPSSAPKTSTTSKRRLGIGEPTKNYLKIPNAYFDLVKQNKLSGSIQRDIILLIMLRTWGAEGRPEYAAISSLAFSEECGGITKQAVGRELQDLIDRKLIEAIDAKGCNNSLRMYKVTPQNWESAPPYGGRSEETPPTEQPSTESSKILVIRPGRKPKCIPARLAPPDREPVDFEIQCTNTGEEPVQISSEVQGQIVRLTLFTEQPKSANKKRTSVTYRLPKTATNVANTRLSEFTAHLKNTLHERFNLTFDPTTVVDDHNFAVQVVTAAGSKLPAEYFADYCARQLDVMRKKRKPISKGLLIAFATQAANEFRSAAPEALAKPERAPLPLPDPEEFERQQELLEREKAAEAEERASNNCTRCKGAGADPIAHGSKCKLCFGSGAKPKARAARC